MTKQLRQGQILKLIQRKPVYTQEELAQELASSGVKATQATLSRDMQELGLVKTGDGYRQVSTSPAGPAFANIASEFVREVRVAQNLLVLRTPPGNANALAVALDREEMPEIVGTIAGDDTILVIAPDSATAQKLKERFLGFLV